MDANPCVHHGSRRAGCITKGARPVRRASVRDQQWRHCTALTLDPYPTFQPGLAFSISDEITAVLGEILQVADDARMERRQSLIDHDALVEEAGTIRRIAYRLATMAVWRLTDPLPRLDDATEAAAEAAFSAMQRRLQSWLAFYQGTSPLSASAAQVLASGHSRNEIAKPVEEFAGRIEARQFARIEAWSLEQRRQMLARLQSLHGLDFLMSELETYLADIPGVAPAAETAPAGSLVSPRKGLNDAPYATLPWNAPIARPGSSASSRCRPGFVTWTCRARRSRDSRHGAGGSEAREYGGLRGNARAVSWDPRRGLG